MPPKSSTPKTTPTKKTKPSQYQRELARKIQQETESKQPLQLAIHYYLVAFNVFSALAWGSVLVRLLIHLVDGKTGVWLEVKNLVGLGGTGAFEVLKARMGTGAQVFGEQTKWFQTLALLELVHAGFGLVRSSFLTTLAQVFSRIFMVWWICERYPVVTKSPIYTSMVFAWSFTEIIRYSFYLCNLIGKKFEGLDWLRYNTFWVLYPLGASSEAWLVYLSAAYAQTAYGTVGLLSTYLILCIWPPSLLFLMFHMNKQRVKHAKSLKSGKKGRKAIKNEVDSGSELLDTPARSTRSRKQVGSA